MFHFVMEYQSALWPEHSCFSLSSALIHRSDKLVQHPASVNSCQELFAQMADGSDHMFRSPSSKRLHACSSSTSSRRASLGHQHCLGNWVWHDNYLLPIFPLPPSLTGDVDMTDSQKFGNVRESVTYQHKSPKRSLVAQIWHHFKYSDTQSGQ